MITENLPILKINKLTQKQYDTAKLNGKINNNELYVIPENNTSSIIPSGLIMMYYGNNIPDGWALCDGTNGTPDLRNRFIIGAGDTYTSGDTGGESVHILTIDEMPKHSHKMKYDSIGWTAIRQSSGTNGIVENTTSSYDGQYSTEEVGNGNAHNNMPPYYALCYIMKL